MPHSITAILLKGDYSQEVAKEYELIGIKLDFDLTLFPIDHAFTAYWQAKLNITGHLETMESDDTLKIIFPDERVIYELLVKVTGRTKKLRFAIISTDYFGGVGTQIGNAYRGDEMIPLKLDSINEALKALGVKRKRTGFLSRSDMDEFDTIGLGNIRSNPDYLDKYDELADELGV